MRGPFALGDFGLKLEIGLGELCSAILYPPLEGFIELEQRGFGLFALRVVPDDAVVQASTRQIQTGHHQLSRKYCVPSLRCPTTSMTPEGLTGLLTFLIQSFQGGTDVKEPLNRALQRLTQEHWARADILMVSDGEFGVPDDIRKRVGEAREKQGLRVHGVLIGNSSDAAMKLLCAPLHRFTSWDVLGEETSTPVR